MDEHKEYYQILLEFQKTAGLGDEEFAELIRIDSQRFRDFVDTCQKPLIGIFASTASGLLRAVETAREKDSGISADVLHSLYCRLVEEYVRLNPDQFEPGFNPYMARSLANLADRTGSRELTQKVRQLLGLEDPETPKMKEDKRRIGTDPEAAESAITSSEDTDSPPDDSDLMFAQVREAWSKLTPSGQRVVWSLIQELSVLKELRR